MGVKTGDKGRHNRQRRKKLARREDMRALRKASSAGTTNANAPDQRERLPQD